MAVGLQALYSMSLRQQSSESENEEDCRTEPDTDDSLDRNMTLNLLPEFNDVSISDSGSSLGFVRRKPGRPVNTDDTTTNQKKRACYRRRKACELTGNRVNSATPGSYRKRMSRESQKNAEAVRLAFKSGTVKEGLNVLAATATIHSKDARKMYGDIVDLWTTSSVEAEVGRNVLSNLKHVGSAHRLAVVKIATSAGKKPQQSIDLTRIADLSGLDRKYVQSAKWLSRDYPEKLPDRLMTDNYAVSVKRVQENKTMLDEVIIAFFESKSQVRSGARRQTRELLLNLADLEKALYSEYPQWLRKLGVAKPELLQTILAKSPATLTRFESSFARAAQDKKTLGFDQDKEELLRWKDADLKYKGHLVHKRMLARAQLAVHKNTTIEAITDEMQREVEMILLQAEDTLNDPANEITDVHAVASSSHTYAYVMQNPPTLAFVVKTLKKHHVRWTSNFKPTECPIHDNGAMNEKAYAIALDKMCTAKQAVSDLQDAIKQANDQKLDVRELRHQESTLLRAYSNAEGIFRQLRDKLQVYTTHLQQYKNCRAVIKQIEENLKVGDCVMYRDFVAAYNCEGRKIQKDPELGLRRPLSYCPKRSTINVQVQQYLRQ